MAITQFIENLADAINAGNRSKVASLLSSATAANWSAAGTDISYVLTDLSRSRLSAADKANFAKTIVEKGTVRSDDLAEVLFEFIGSRNFSAAHATLTAATKGELQSDPRFYGDLLQEVSRSELTAAQQAELARLIVTKTTVDSDSLVEAVFGFIGNNNYVAAHASLNGAAAAELKSDPRFYGDLLQEVSRSELTAEQQTELAKLIVTKTTVNSDDLIEALFGFVGNSNYTAAFHTLNSAAAAELKSDPRFYGDLLQEVSRSELTPAQQAWLAKTIVTKTIVNSDDLVEAAFGFIGNNNYAAVYHTLSSAAAGELTSDPRFYGDLLQEVSRSELTAAQQVEIAKLIVAKTTVDSDNLVEAVFGFVGNNNFHAASATLNAAGTNELKSDPRFYGDLLQEVSRSELTAAQQAELARLIVTKTTVDSSYLADALYGFMEMRNTGAVNTIMLNASAAEKAQFTAELHSELAKFGYKAGHDIVKDTAGNDVLYGYNGNDTLYGGFGRDTLTGGKGSDRFVLSDKVFRDTITDFSVAEKDVLILSKSLFSKSVADIDKAIDDFVIARTSGNDTIISIDADGKGAGKAVDVALLQNVKGIDVDVLHNKGIIDIA